MRRLKYRSRSEYSISFAGCAWLFPFHLGVVDHLKHVGLNACNTVFLGSSSGALAALIASMGLDAKLILEEVKGFATDAQSRSLGPIGRMSHYVSSGLSKHVSPKACESLNSSLQICVTKFPGYRSEIFKGEQMRNKQALMNILLGSCYIPVYYEKPVFWRKALLLDEGFSNNLPLLNPYTITVSPFPRHLNTRVDISAKKKFKGSQILFPNRLSIAEQFDLGKNAAAAYFK